ncbi:MAG: xylulokinase [Ignavibacteriales bacterium]|nr:xylulokinase [Ignavibacteriales bacterium]
MKKYALGLDIGTSGVKGIIIDDDGTTVALATEEYPLSTPKPNWAEQDPEDWWRASVKVIRKLTLGRGKSRGIINAVGFSGQMHSMVLLDARDKVLRPAILWCDTRTDAECRWIHETIGRQKLRELVGNPALEGFTLPKLVWVKNQEPRVYQRIKKVLLPKDYIRYRLTGGFATEVSDASGTLLFDVSHRRWSEVMLQTLSLSREWFPTVSESTDVSGKITTYAAEETGLQAGTPVAGGGADNASGAVGSGVVKNGRVLASIGTSGVVLAHSDGYQVDPEMRVHTFCHSVPSRWYVMGVVLMAGGALRWFKDTFASNDFKQARSKGADVYDMIADGARKTPPGAEGLQFLPYLIGERTPHQSASARASFVGASIRHTKDHFARSVFEGITFAMRDSFEIIKSLGIPIEQVRLTGGGARNKFWRKLQADIYGQEVVTVNTTEGPALGAALMAGVASGIFENLVEAVERVVKITETTEPDVRNSESYNQSYELFRETYSHLEPVYMKMHQRSNAQERSHSSNKT